MRNTRKGPLFNPGPGTDQNTHRLSLIWVSLFVDIYYSIHWFCKWTTKALISLRIRSGLSGPVLSANYIPASFVRCASYHEPRSEKTYFLIWATNEDSNLPWHSRSFISLSCPYEETLHPLPSKMRPVKILIRLRECADWSESLLGHTRPKHVF